MTDKELIKKFKNAYLENYMVQDADSFTLELFIPIIREEIKKELEEYASSADCFQEDHSVAWRAGDIIIGREGWQDFWENR